jgi:anti-sigma B factor antagonist
VHAILCSSIDRPQPDVVVVRLVGELDVSSIPVLVRALDVVSSCGGVALVTLDLAELTFVDAGGLGAMARAREQQQARGRDLVLRAPRPLVRRLLRIAGMEDELPCVDEIPSPASAGSPRGTRSDVGSPA